MEVLVEPGETYEVPKFGQVPYLDVAATLSSEDGTASLFILNRDLNKSRQLELNWESKPASRLLTGNVLTGTDLKAVNGFEKPDRVVPQAAEKPVINGNTVRLEVPPRSYSVYQWAV